MLVSERRTGGVLFIISLALAGCAGGGGGGNLAVPNATSSVPIVPPPESTAIGTAVQSPAAASFGSSPPPAQLATPGGPGFLNAVGPDNRALPIPEPPPIGTVFPVLATSLQFGTGGATTVSGVQSASATILPFNCSPVPACDVSVGYQLLIPSLGLNVSTNAILAPALAPALNYVELGDWRGGFGGYGAAPQSYTAYLFGYETPVSALPTTGTATFSGGTLGTEYLPVSGQLTDITVTGSASISVDFASGKLTGALTQMQALTSANFNSDIPNTNYPVVPWNDVSLSASITAGTSKFSGTTAAASNPQSAYSLSGSATGTINGGFYGPNAQELGAIWTLGDGVGSVIGAIGVKRQ